MVKKSKLVFAHYSTSVSYAVILKKPIVLLNSRLMFDIGYFSKILSMSIETGGKMVDINNPDIDYVNLYKNNYSSYQNYLKKYLKSSKSKKKRFWNIISSEIIK